MMHRSGNLAVEPGVAAWQIFDIGLPDLSHPKGKDQVVGEKTLSSELEAYRHTNSSHTDAGCCSGDLLGE